MGYPRSLDEYTDVELQTELERRRRARAEGLCDYCKRQADENACRFPDRHYQAALIFKTLSGE